MDSKTYREQNGCWNCKHIVIFKADGTIILEDTIYCFLNKGEKKPKCRVCTLRRSEMEKEHRDIVCPSECSKKMVDYFDDYVDEFGICDNWEEDSPVSLIHNLEERKEENV